MIGSYGPRPEPYEKTFASSEAPSGMMARGNYNVRSRVVDDDNHVFADWEWAFKVSKLIMLPILRHDALCRLTFLNHAFSSTDRQGLVKTFAPARLRCFISPPILFSIDTTSILLVLYAMQVPNVTMPFVV